MSDAHDRPAERRFGRRAVLLGGLAALLGVPRAAQATYIPVARSLTIYARNTGERFSGTYFEHGQYLPDALAEVTRLFRDRHDGTSMPVDPRLLDILVTIHEHMGAQRGFDLICGFRSSSTNARARRRDRHVARNSYHLQNMAADVTLPGFSLRDLRRAATQLRLGGVGTYRGQRLVHLDSGPFRTW